ncbi:MAG: hypothetical protein ACOVRN_16905 [Flavobacterium sp.]
MEYLITNELNSADVLCLSSYDKHNASRTHVDSVVNSRTELSADAACHDEELDTNATMFTVNIYRYKFTNDFMEELYKFAKIHQYDHRKDFKEAWEQWVEDNQDIVDDESRRLSDLGYDGDVIDKMFKSARYYFRKKSTEKKKPTKRRVYVGSQKELLEAMDEHITSNILRSSVFKPSDGFDEFCLAHDEQVKEQIVQLVRAGITDVNEIKTKIKKTYKNRYFLIIQK